MYLQGTAIWHPRCGPGPSENGTTIFNGGTTAEVDRISNSAMSEIQVSLLFPLIIIQHVLSTSTTCHDWTLSPFLCCSYQNLFLLNFYVFFVMIFFYIAIMIYISTVFITFTYT